MKAPVIKTHRSLKSTATLKGKKGLITKNLNKNSTGLERPFKNSKMTSRIWEKSVKKWASRAGKVAMEFLSSESKLGSYFMIHIY